MKRFEEMRMVRIKVGEKEKVKERGKVKEPRCCDLVLSI